jgi:hypothetical protein
MGVEMTIAFNSEERERSCKGYFVYDCAVRDAKTFTFLLLQNQADAASGSKRLLTYFPYDKDGERLDWSTYEGFSGPKIAASTTPKNQTVMVSRSRLVATLGGGADEMEHAIPKGVLFSCFSLATIDGSIYAVGPWRSVAKRLGQNQWESLTGDRSTLPLPPKVVASNDGGFEAIAGFNTNDIYCVGGKGDAWRYDGQRWYQCKVPTDMYFESVCCAGDGHVYIGMQSGSVMRGREDRWEIIHRDEMTLPFKDMVWFDGRVWCTSHYGLWVIEDGKLKEADVPPEVKACSGNLSVGDGVMLLAGMYGASVHDGKRWNRLA